MTSAHDPFRVHVRVTLAEALHRGVTHEELLEDVLCASRGVGAPGHREELDAVDLAQAWREADEYAALPPLDEIPTETAEATTG